MMLPPRADDTVKGTFRAMLCLNARNTWRKRININSIFQVCDDKRATIAASDAIAAVRTISTSRKEGVSKEIRHAGKELLAPFHCPGGNLISDPEDNE